MDNLVWDLAGVDGLAVARQLFGEDVSCLAPFQSLETTLQGQDCSVLRLCDRNFRIVYSGALQQLVGPLEANIWLNQFDWLARLLLPTTMLATVSAQATVRPPHRLVNSPNHQAVPIQLQTIPLLLWQHSWRGEPTLELHAAKKDVEMLSVLLRDLPGNKVLESERGKGK